MAAFQARAVQIRLVAGAIVIGEPAPALLTEAIRLAGATAYVDIAELDAPPAVLVQDPGRALWWIGAVLGQAVSDAVRELLDADDVVPPITALATPSLLTDAVVRFALGSWLLHWWPSSDRENVPPLTEAGLIWLRTELGVLAWYAEDAFGDSWADWSMLHDCVDQVLETATTSSGTEYPLATVRAVLETVPLDPDTYDQLILVEDALVGSVEAAKTLEFELSLRSPDRVTLGSGRATDALRYRGGGPARDTTGQRVATGRSTVEWGRVRPRSLGAREDNVVWSLNRTPAGNLTIEVRVPLGPGWSGEPAYAAVYAGESSFPETVLELQPDDPGARSLSAHARVSADLLDAAISVVVYDDSGFDNDRATASTTDDRDLVVATVARLVSTAAGPGPDVAPYDRAPSARWRVPGAAPRGGAR